MRPGRACSVRSRESGPWPARCGGRTRRERGWHRSSSAGVALYGALALAIFSVASGPEGFDALEPGSATFAGMVLWAVALAAVVAGAASGAAVREAFPRAAPVLEILAHAVGVSGALAGAVAAFSLVPGSEAWVDLASALTPGAVALAFFVLEPRRPRLVHLAVVATAVTSFLLARVQVPGVETWWWVGPAAVAAVLMLVARQCESAGLRIRLLAWGVALSLGSMILRLPGEGGLGSVERLAADHHGRAGGHGRSPRRGPPVARTSLPGWDRGPLRCARGPRPVSRAAR